MKEHLDQYGIEKKEGVDEVLHTLKAAGYQTAVVTATDEERDEKLFKRDSYSGSV